MVSLVLIFLIATIVVPTVAVTATLTIALVEVRNDYRVRRNHLHGDAADRF